MELVVGAIEDDHGSRIVKLREYEQTMGKKVPPINSHSAKRTFCLHRLAQLIELAEWMQLDLDSEDAVQADSMRVTQLMA